MRMFVAVRPPDSIVDDLDRFSEPRREADSPLRWSRPESWHITLAFLPAVADADLDELVERLGETAAAAGPFTLELTGSGAFPNPARAKLLWQGVGGGVERLAHLAGNVRSACGRAGTQVEGGPYRPHLTLARIGRPLDVTRWLPIFQSYRSEPWTVDDIVLYESHLGAGPSRYEARAAFPLGSDVR